MTDPTNTFKCLKDYEGHQPLKEVFSPGHGENCKFNGAETLKTKQLNYKPKNYAWPEQRTDSPMIEIIILLRALSGTASA